MGRRRDHRTTMKSYTLPSSPTHSFSSTSSSDFEFTISLSPRKSSAANLCPADELFYKGQLLPLHPSPRISMVRTLLLSSSSSSSSSDATTTASRHSTSSSCDSSRPSSATEHDVVKPIPTTNNENCSTIKTSKYSFSLSRFSNVFRKEPKPARAADVDAFPGPGPSPMKRVSSTAKEVIRKYLKKVKPLYEKLSQNDRQPTRMVSTAANFNKNSNNNNFLRKNNDKPTISHSFLDNLRHPRGRSCVVSSCPGSMRSSPSHSGILSRKGFSTMSKNGGAHSFADSSSSMEELQSAIQGAIAHCKNSMLQNRSTVSDYETGV